MHTVMLTGCTATPFGNYLKALGVFRLVSKQADTSARGWWAGETFALESVLGQEDLETFFVERYAPTPILAPWNGGSGFYPKDNNDGIEAIARSAQERFAPYRKAIEICREFNEIKQGKGADEEERRAAILRHCRNRLDDDAVEWLDAAVAISADGSRSFAPVLGTGGNEGRLDYTNNFMARIAALLILPGRKMPVRELLGSALFGHRTTALLPGAAGQFDPGRAGGANQGPGIAHDSTTNPWDLILTLEGATAWASGLYRRQGIGYRSVLCSPFTVRPSKVGYESAVAKDDARGEIWTPLWLRPVRYEELKTLLREGRASVNGRPAANALEFAEAACSLGVDRGIDRFVRYSLLKRRGDSYVALPTGIFKAEYRSESDRVRQFQQFFERFTKQDLPRGAEEARRGVEGAVYQVLLKGGNGRVRELMVALGRMLRRIVTVSDVRLPSRGLNAADWIEACDFDVPEVRMAASVASIFARDIGSLADNLSRGDKRFAWVGLDLTDRMISVLERRLQLANSAESDANPLGGACTIHPGEVSLFIECSVNDALVEDLLFAFATLDWTNFKTPSLSDAAVHREVLPTYAVIKHLFLSREIEQGPEPKRLRADPRVLSLLKAGNIEEAAAMAVTRLRVAGFRPLVVGYAGGMNARRLAASLLIPVLGGRALGSGIFHEKEEDNR